jgi:hypothetical protein
MHDDTNSATTTRFRDTRRIRWRARTLAWTAPIAVLALLFAGCGGSGGPGVASAGSSKSGGGRSSSTGSKKASALAYSKCMRAHGVTDFPDPDSKGQLTINKTGGPGSSDLDPNNAQFQAAQEACKSLAPRPHTPAQQASRRADALKFAKCMRDHGITDFPDPNASGGLEIKGSPGGSPGDDLDPNSPQFQSAQKACKHLLPGSGKTKTQTQANTPQ